MGRIRHLLGISGGKDSAALAVYMKDKYPLLDIEYYTCDTGMELDETYELIKNLEVYLGKKQAGGRTHLLVICNAEAVLLRLRGARWRVGGACFERV